MLYSDALKKTKELYKNKDITPIFNLYEKFEGKKPTESLITGGIITNITFVDKFPKNLLGLLTITDGVTDIQITVPFDTIFDTEVLELNVGDLIVIEVVRYIDVPKMVTNESDKLKSQDFGKKQRRPLVMTSLNESETLDELSKGVSTMNTSYLKDMFESAMITQEKFVFYKIT